MTYSEELSTGPVSSKQLVITNEGVRFDGVFVAAAEITGFRYQQTVNKLQGIRVSMAFEIYLSRKDGTEFPVCFMGLAGSTANMEKQYGRIIEHLWMIAGNRILNGMYKDLLEGRSIKISQLSLTPKGIYVEKHKLFGKNTEQLVKWEDVDYGMTASSRLVIKSLAGDGVSAEIDCRGTLNGFVVYSLLRWLYADADRIAAIYYANGIEY
jgi:hypothetical protein